MLIFFLSFYCSHSEVAASTVTIYKCPSVTGLALPNLEALDPEYKVLPAVNANTSGMGTANGQGTLANPIQQIMESPAGKLQSHTILTIAVLMLSILILW